MDFGKSIGLVAVAAIGGLALYFFSKKSGTGSGDPGVGRLTIDGETYEFPLTPGEHVISRAGNGNGGDDLAPEYVPPILHETQAPEADPTYQLGTPENPLYADTSGLTMIPHVGVGSWYEIRDIEQQFGLSPAEFQEELAVIRSTNTADKTADQLLISGEQTTREGAERSEDFRERVKLYGGEYVGGVLVPPDNWGGSVTEYAQYVRSSIDRTGMGWIN